MKTAPKNKRCESYARLLSESLEIRGKAKNKTVFNRKRKKHNRNKGKMRYNIIIESHTLDEKTDLLMFAKGANMW